MERARPIGCFLLRKRKMSRNFELLERVRQEQELFRVPKIRRTQDCQNGMSGDRSLDLDAFAREEVFKLIQCLFVVRNGNHKIPSRRVVFCGINDDQGSSLLCTRIGQALAERAESQVCVVDANLRTPKILDFFASHTRVRERFEQRNVPGSLQWITNNLCVLSNQTLAKNGPQTLAQLQTMIDDLTATVGYWVINAAPIGLCSDAIFLGQNADGVVLVIEANSTRRVAARKAKQALEAAKVQVLGTVFNNRTFPIPEKVYRRL